MRCILSILILFSTTMLSACNKIDFEEFGVHLVKETRGVNDRTWVIHQGVLTERRWSDQANSWIWIEHSAASAEIADLAKGNLSEVALGPAICDDTPVCRIYIRLLKTNAAASGEFFTPLWAHYSFSPLDTSYDDFSTFNIGNVDPFVERRTACTSNLSLIPNGRMVCAFEDDNNRTHLFEVSTSLDVIQITSQNYSTNALDPDINYDPCVADQDHRFMEAAGKLYHFTRFHEETKERNRVRDIGDALLKPVLACPYIRRNGKLYLTTYDATDEEWTHSTEGRPDNMKRRKMDGYAMGSIRAMQERNKIFLLARPKGSKMHLYERYTTASNTRQWADHGYPGNDDLTEIGMAMAAPGGDTLFLMTEQGNLWMRQWNHGVGGWVWDNHGKP